MEPEKSSYYNELAIASLTIGILSFIQLFGLERSITAVVFGILALKRIKQDESQRGKKMAMAGIILGIIYTLLAIIIMPHAIELAKSIINNAK
ncbi:MAG: DUF4190 domain-containing protein [Candidatus Omnitrophica bacterium]|nr:DUF4190 domain-containing protein [Candidatus Omnitrophota bacterium]MDD5352916.1 DUF4190 domain-containing protein [Candidatus Omnitrophota bacterium]MDD5550515.1 DUF4190 domain-containing protein [Candidatus Omnitrophota bacterium]